MTKQIQTQNINQKNKLSQKRYGVKYSELCNKRKKIIDDMIIIENAND
jgi:hypothetical protein